MTAVFVMLLGYRGSAVQAEEARRISRVSLKFETKIQPEMNFGDETIDAGRGMVLWRGWPG